MEYAIIPSTATRRNRVANQSLAGSSGGVCFSGSGPRVTRYCQRGYEYLPLPLFYSTLYQSIVNSRQSHAENPMEENMLYNDALRLYLQSLRRGGRSEYTIANYQGRLKQLGEHLGNIEIVDVTIHDLREWIDANLQGHSAYTIWSLVVTVRAFFNWCQKEGIIPESPARRLEKPRLPSRLPKALTHQEIFDLIQACKRSQQPERNVAIVTFMLETGARRGAVANLMMPNLYVNEGYAKTITKGNKEIWLFFGETTKRALNQWLAVRDPRFFHHSVDPNSVFGLKADGFRLLLERLSQSLPRKISPHVLRHTSATLRVEQGIDSSSLQQIMGWSDIRMAEVYTRLALHRLQQRALSTSPLDKAIIIDIG